jgi:ribonuclease D
MEKLAKTLALPRSELYYIDTDDAPLSMKITVTLRAKRVEKWIRTVQRNFLDAAAMKIVGLDCEFTDPRKPNQCAAVLQLSVAYETLVFQIVYADDVPQVLKDFLADKNIYFCGAAIGNDVKMLSTYGIIIPSAIDLQKILVNPTQKNLPGLYDLANHYLGTTLKKKKKDKNTPMTDEAKALIFGWGDVPLSRAQVTYAALDARVGFELGRKHFNALGYNTHDDRLNLNIYE